MSLEPLVGWLITLPPATLLWAMALLALAENVFPPIPADVLIALGAFLAARVGASPWPTFFAVLGGNVVGAMTMYAVGRRFGADWTERRFHLRHRAGADAALSSWYARYGLASLFLGRFIPGVRAIVPPFAGALRAPVTATATAIVVASGLWYGLVTIISYRAGTNWEQLVRVVGRLGTTSALVAGGLVAAVASLWWLHRRRRRG